MTDKSWVTLIEHDGWYKGWILSDSDVPVAKWRQQGGDSLMIWAGIFKQTIIGLLKFDEWIKLKSAYYCDFMDKIVFEFWTTYHCSLISEVWFYAQQWPFSFIQVNTWIYLIVKRFTGETITERLPSSHELNTNENIWPIVKMQLYEVASKMKVNQTYSQTIIATNSETKPAEVKMKINKING